MYSLQRSASSVDWKSTKPHWRVFLFARFPFTYARIIGSCSSFEKKSNKIRESQQKGRFWMNTDWLGAKMDKASASCSFCWWVITSFKKVSQKILAGLSDDLLRCKMDTTHGDCGRHVDRLSSSPLRSRKDDNGKSVKSSTSVEWRGVVRTQTPIFPKIWSSSSGHPA